jgi:mono/diheme cytochrome c family protein
MYYIDPNIFMNWLVGIILGITVLLVALTLGIGAARKTTRGPLMSYLYMLTILFGAFSAIVVGLGLRGRASANRPWHFFLDMKYQAKYTNQGGSKFFADGRGMRVPPEGTVPFDGTDYAADAGRHADPSPDFLKADARYFLGVANPTAKETQDGVQVPKPPEWKDGQLVEGYYVGRIPDAAVRRAGGWEALIRRGQQQFNVNCAVCHGASGRGGLADAAYGIVGAYGPSVAPANLHTDDVRSNPDGRLFDIITNGVRNMPAYAHQVKVQDRWAVVAYMRVLQYAHLPPAAK